MNLAQMKAYPNLQYLTVKEIAKSNYMKLDMFKSYQVKYSWTQWNNKWSFLKDVREFVLFLITCE